jgi:predicted TPR repeat methyltransferase
MKMDDRLARSRFVAMAPAEDGYLAYDTNSGKLHRLNPAAALIMELCDGTRNAAEICEQLAPILGSSGADACLQWLDTAKLQGLVEPAPSDVSAATGSPESFASLASDLREDGNVLAAFVCQHYATFLAPEDGEQWCALGDLAHIVGRRNDAREAYERYLALLPGDAEVEQILKSLRDEAPPPRAPDLCIKQLYSRFSEFYEDNMCGDLEYQGPERLVEAIEAEFPALRDLDVLDLGCGTGLAGKVLRPRARRLIGIDLSPEMVARAQATGFYDHLEVAEVTDWLSRCTETFSLIVAIDTMIYFGDLRQVLIPAYRHLHPDGWLVFTVERGEKPPFCLTDSGRYAHTATHITEAAQDAGFCVSRVSEGFLRYEYGEPVTALIAVLRKLHA